MKITILSENYAANTDYAEWGFAALIEWDNRRILFDTGLTGSCIIENAKKLQIDLTYLDAIVLSHGHDDHTGGLVAVLEHSQCREIFAHPDVFTTRFSQQDDGQLQDISCPYSQKDLEQKFGVHFQFFTSFTEIFPNIFMTGEVPFSNQFEQLATNLVVKDCSGEFLQDTFTDDNSLCFKLEQGLLILLGCAHRGMVNISSYCKQKLGCPIYAIVGGTHLYRASDQHYQFVESFLKNEQVKKISPGHCTGMQRIFDLQNKFSNKVCPAFCGVELKF